MTTFAKATKKQAKLKIALNGPAGSGKTYTALVIAKILGGKVALADSEHGRASLYAGIFDFDAGELESFSLDTYIDTLRTMAAQGYSVGILDSISHAWTGKCGALEEVDKRGGTNKFTSGWSVVTPKQNEFIDTIRAYPGHLICTMRKKMDYVLETNDKGKQVPKKVGLAPVQRDGVEYEFDFIFDLDVGGTIHVGKSSAPELGLDNAVLTRAELPKVVEKIKAWLEDGAPVAAAQLPMPRQSAADKARAEAILARARILWAACTKRGMTAEEWPKWVESVLGTPKPSKEFDEDDLDQLENASAAEDEAARRNGAAKQEPPSVPA